MSSALRAAALESLRQAGRARIDLDADSIMLKADPTLLLTAVVAALERALERDSGRIRIRTQARDGSALLAITSSDPSPAGKTDDGICMAVLERVAALHGGRVQLEAAALELTIPVVPS